MAAHKGRIGPGRWVGRTLLIGGIELAAFVAVARVLGGVELTGFWAAVEFTLFVGFANALLWPILARLTLPFLVVSFGFLTLLLNGLLFWLGGQLIAGVHFNNYFYALATAVAVSLVNTTVSLLLTIDEDASFYRAVLQRAMRRLTQRQPQRAYPGLLFLEIDGLAEPVLRQAMAAGHTPLLARLLAGGSHTLQQWETDLSSQTGAAQAGILHGNNFNIPAFRWVEKAEGNHVVTTNRLRDARAIERRISDGTGLLRHRGCSRANLFSGDAEDAMLTYSLATSVPRLLTPSYFSFFSNPYNFVRTLSLAGAEMLHELHQQFRQARAKIHPRLPERRRGLYPLVRAATTVLLRDITVDTLITDVLAGEADVIYATFAAYDEVAHHAGVTDRDAFRTLAQLDRAIARIARAVQEADRAYEIAVLSDHGQTGGATFKQRYGVTLQEVIQQLLPAELRIHARLQSNEDWGHVAALVNEVALQESHRVGRLVRSVTRRRRADGEVIVGPEFHRQQEEQAGRAIRAEDAQVIVLASGNLGLAYFTDWCERLTLEQFEQHFPGLIDGLVRHPGIGFVLVRSEHYGPLALGARGVYYLAQDRVTGENPLASFTPNAPMHLRRIDLYDNTPDLLINSFYDPIADEGCAFEELIGFHGGLGGGQNYPFLLTPIDWKLHTESVVGAEHLHRLLKRRIEAARQAALVRRHASGTAVAM